MTYPDRRLEGPLEPPETRTQNTQDVVPPTERSQDPQRPMHELVSEGSRPLTDEERKAADRDEGVAERVYAPASERVPKTVEGHRDVIEHTDTQTPERQAVGQASPASTSPGTTTEPSFTRVTRPGPIPENDWSAQSEVARQQRWMSNITGSSAMPFGIGWLTLGVCGGVGVWLWMRWQRERNRPINRLRRQARETASQARQRANALREQMPELGEFPDEARRPAMGLGTALLTVALVLWRQSQARSRADARSQARTRSRDMSRRADKASREARQRAERASRKASDLRQQAVQTMADVDWLERLEVLRQLWRQRAPMAR